MSNYETQIIDESNIKDWRTELPNSIIKGSKSYIGVYAKWLYVYLKSVAGEKGKCWQSTKTIAEGSGISAGKVSQCKKELEDAGLITIEKGDVKKGNSDTIRIKDIWASNILEFQKKHTHSRDEHPHSRGEHTPSSHEHTPSRDEHPHSRGEHTPSSHEHTPSRDEPKKNPIKKEPYEEEGHTPKKYEIPTQDQVETYFREQGTILDEDISLEAEKFMNHYAEAEWKKRDGSRIKNWHRQTGTWAANYKQFNRKRIEEQKENKRPKMLIYNDIATEV